MYAQQTPDPRLQTLLHNGAGGIWEEASFGECLGYEQYFCSPQRCSTPGER
jgi:hypothetical protein